MKCLGSFLDDDGQEKKMRSSVVLLVGECPCNSNERTIPGAANMQYR